MKSHLIVHPTKSSSSTIDQFEQYFLMHSIIFIHYGFYPISGMSSTYTIIITFLSSFNRYKIQGLVLHCLDPTLRVVLLMYSMNPHRANFIRP